MSCVRLSQSNGLQMQKNSKNYKQFAKTQTIEAIKIIIYFVRTVLFFQLLFIINQLKYTEWLQMSTWASFENSWGCFYEIVLKTREKRTNILNNNKTFMKTHIVIQTKFQLRHNIDWHFNFDLQLIGWNLTMARTRTTKTVRFKKHFWKRIIWI